jgi:hypothetical protein
MEKVLLNINLKHILLLAVIIYTTENIYAQKERKNYISVNYSFGLNRYNRDGATVGFRLSQEYRGNDFKGIAIEYARKTSSNAEFCTGLTATAAYIATTSTYHSGNGSNTSNYDNVIGIFSLPLHLRYHFAEYLFVEGGLNLNYYSSMGYKYGAGLSASIGMEHVFHSGITLFASSFVQWNLMMNSSNEINMGNAGTYFMLSPDKLLQLGVKLGVGYRF